MTRTALPRETGRTGVMRAVCDLLTAERVWWMRCNTGAMRYGNNRMFHWGRKGMADILALRKTLLVDTSGKYGRMVIQAVWIETKAPRGKYGRMVIQAVWIETKAPRGKQTPEQRAFQQEVEAEGHTYLLIDDPTQLQEWLRRNK